MAFVNNWALWIRAGVGTKRFSLINDRWPPCLTDALRRSCTTASLQSTKSQNCRRSLNADTPCNLLATITSCEKETGSDVESAPEWMFALMGMLAAVSNPAYLLAQEAPEGLKELFKSIPVSLMHPGVMWIVFGTGIYTFWLGYQASLVRKAEPEKRKALVKAKVGKRHFSTSASLFATMTVFTFIGMANTYARTGKLFPGPHLYTGLSIIALMSIMSSLVPSMLDGKLWARNTHFTLAIGVLSLLSWQAKTGMDIVGKLLGWT